MSNYTRGWKHTEKTLEKMRQRRRDAWKNNPRYHGHSHTTEERERIRLAALSRGNRGKIGMKYKKVFHGFPDGSYEVYYKRPFRKPSPTANNRKGKTVSTETRKKMSESRVRYLKTVRPTFMTSISGKVFLDELEKLWNVQIEREVELEGRFFDGCVGNLLIEVDNSYWHSLPHRVLVDQQKDEIAKRNGYKLKRFVVESSKDVKNVISEIGDSHE